MWLWKHRVVRKSAQSGSESQAPYQDIMDVYINSISGRYLVRKSGMVDAIQFGSDKLIYLAGRSGFNLAS